ncbi:MAG: alpha/beta fold hydrolase [Sandaracinus sp.]
MTALLVVAIAALVVLIAMALHYRGALRRYGVEVPYGLVERLPTPDGACIELRRLPGDVVSSLPPVLCVHGIAIDHRNNDMLETLSLARSLRARGRDVWLLTLRSGIESPSFRHVRRVRFDAMVRHDVPMGVEEVRRRTGASAIDYVGFSMGGMLLYAALGRTVEPSAIRRVVILGSPGKMIPPLRVIGTIARVPRWLVPGAPLRIGARMIAFLAEWLHTPLHTLVYNRRNVARGVTPAALMTVRDIAQPLMADFAGFLASGGVVRFEGAPVLEGLAHVRSPVRFFAGAGDRIAPPAAVRAAYDAWGASETGVDKEMIVLAAGTHDHDYGHGDLAIGQNLARDVFEPAVAFLDAA